MEFMEFMKSGGIFFIFGVMFHLGRIVASRLARWFDK